MTQFHSTTNLPLHILIVDDESTIRTTLSMCLMAAGHHPAEAASGSQGLALASAQVFDLIFLDLRLGAENGMDYILPFLEQNPWLKIVVITAYASIETAVEAMRRGAIDYLPQPFTPEQVELLATRIAETRVLESRVRELREALQTTDPAVALLSRNRAMQSALALAQRFAESDTVVLLEGESGAGKQTLARAIHNWSPRRAGPFLVATPAGRSDDAIATDLFGIAGTPGISRVEHCSGGTLYVEDIGELATRLQLKLLQLIQTGAFERDGKFDAISVDLRVIAGTRIPLASAVHSGVFREDVYFALSGKTIELPPLRDRPEDFRGLAENALAACSRRYAKLLTGFTGEAFDYLQKYSWPGNLRELRNIIERAVILARPPNIGLADLPPNMLASSNAALVLGDLVALEQIEEQHIRGVLSKVASLENAAKILGIDYATLWRRRKKYGL